jgi:hypothetical protein
MVGICLEPAWVKREGINVYPFDLGTDFSMHYRALASGIIILLGGKSLVRQNQRREWLHANRQ